MTEYICAICETAKPKDSFKFLSNCSHYFCLDCLLAFFKLRIEEAIVLKIPCPYHRCEAELTESELLSLLPQNLIEKYKTFKRNEELSSVPFFKWCPIPDCTGYDTGSLQKTKLTCNICQNQYCFYCSEPWHLNEKCKGQSDQALDQWSKQNGVKYCPNCKRKVQKNKGCEHMTCIKCRYEWCWLCGAKYASGHSMQCEAIKLRKWDRSVSNLLLLVFSLIVVVFLPIGGFINHVYQDSQVIHQSKIRLIASYLLSILCGIMILPIYWSVGPVVLSVFLTYKTFREFGFVHLFSYLASLILGLVGIPLTLAFLFLGILIATILGLSLTIIKIYITTRRCWQPRYLRPQGWYNLN